MAGEEIQDIVVEDLLEVIDLIGIIEAGLVQLQPDARNIETVLELTAKRFNLFTLLAGFVLGEERANFVYQKVAESFKSDIYMKSDENTLDFLAKLILKFKEQKLKGFDKTDNQKHLEICNIYKRMGMLLTEEERTGMHIDMQEAD